MAGLLRRKIGYAISAIFILSLIMLVAGTIADAEPAPAPGGDRAKPAVGERGLPAEVCIMAPAQQSIVPLAAERILTQESMVTRAQPLTAATPEQAAPARDCDVDSTIIYSPDEPQESFCPGIPEDTMSADRAYLVVTASPGYTMMRQGPDVAIGRLNPEFVHRLAAGIREARPAGLSSAGIFSAYRPPAFGVGGFSNKFNSLHTYGLAVDMTGIGGPGSAEAKTWYEIAARHNIVCPYSVDSRTEWNHCQPTRVKIIPAEDPLRGTVTADGPVNLESMFEAGTA